ncbi:hypothetical protein [Sphingomonas sp.]|jgi:hypothetical protein|uniref:hypothetical protein n=1 Tax=Sphingomonas sp. TaxID=28214 RepID=UPI002D80926F|nr:hypothetical protein [Sphingomonas sp.]HEU0044389.1 hypothetical protein [Sphingomonas sp.]
MTRLLLIGLGALTVAGCGQQESREAAPAEMTTTDMAAASRAESRAAGFTAPGINVTAAPGVAFIYRYGFRLPAARISAAQESHAQACEKLGTARCRVTGMRYRLLGENNIEAALDLKLAPELARGFGKEGIAVVERADGTLVDAEITGTDAGAVIDRSRSDGARAGDELRRLDAAIAGARTGVERAELQAQRAEIARRIAAAGDTAATARESLAQTPVSFLYESGPAVRGFDTSAPLTSAIDTAIGSAQATFAVLLGILAIFGPPALALGLALYLFLRGRAAWRRRTPRATVSSAPPAD